MVTARGLYTCGHGKHGSILEACICNFRGYLNLKLANAQRIKNVPGRKTDVSDAEWIAKLLRAGLIAGSFIPNKDIRELRELTRYRKNPTLQLYGRKEQDPEGTGVGWHQTRIYYCGRLWSYRQAILYMLGIISSSP